MGTNYLKRCDTKNKWLDIIAKAKIIYEESLGEKDFGEILKSLGVDYGLFLKKWRNHLEEKIVTYKHRVLSESHTASIYYQSFSATPKEKLKPVKPVKIKKVKVNKHLAFILLEIDRGKSQSNIAVTLGCSREYVRQILVSSGFDYNELRPKIDTIKSQDIALSSYLYIKRKAFTYGVSVADYLNLKNKLGKVIFGLLQHKIYRIETNKDKVKLLEKGDEEEQLLGLYLQMSMLEILEVYLEAAVKNYPEMNNREALLRVLKDGRSFILSRKDFSKPYTKENAIVRSEQDFGIVFGKSFGTSSEYQKSKK